MSEQKTKAQQIVPSHQARGPTRSVEMNNPYRTCNSGRDRQSNRPRGIQVELSHPVSNPDPSGLAGDRTERTVFHEGVSMSKVVADLQQTQGVAKLLWVVIVFGVLYNMMYDVATPEGAANSASIVSRVLDGVEEAAMDGDAMARFFKNKLVDEFLDPSREVRLRAMAAGVEGAESDVRCRYSAEERVAAGLPADAELTYDLMRGACILLWYDYKTAVAACTAKNMTLPIVRSAADNTALQGMHPYENGAFWLGASNENGAWEWQDGTHMAGFTNWGGGDGTNWPDEPNGGDNECLAHGHGYGWYDTPCTRRTAASPSNVVCQNSNVDLKKRYVTIESPLPAKLNNFRNRTHGDIALWLDFDLGRAVDSSRNHIEIEALGEELLETSRVQRRVGLCPTARRSPSTGPSARP
jgi:hypothetical protein